MQRFCKIVSAVFSPLLAATYGLVVAFVFTYLNITSTSVLVRLGLYGFAITCIMPVAAIIALYKLGLIKDAGLNERTERTIPYLVVALSYGVCSFLLYRAKAPDWLWLFLVGGCVATVICTVVNRWWKISAHAAAVAGVAALTFRITVSHAAAKGVDMLWVSAIAVTVWGLVATARLYLGCHTLWQVLAGTAVGAASVWLLTAL